MVVMEPTDCELHAGCLGNLNATWTFRGRSGHSARPWHADNAIHRAALGIATLASAPVLPVQSGGLDVPRGGLGDAGAGRDRPAT